MLGAEKKIKGEVDLIKKKKKKIQIPVKEKIYNNVSSKG